MMTVADIMTETQLGRASVLEVFEDRVRVRFQDQAVWAEPALGYPYHPTPGDIVLVIGKEEAHFVIGVLRGRGRTVLSVPGDLDLEAPNGRINLVAGEGIHAEAPEISLEGRKIRVLAETLSERLGAAYRWVKGLFQIQTGRMRTLADSTVTVQAERIVEKATKDVKIDGQTVRLG